MCSRFAIYQCLLLAIFMLAGVCSSSQSVKASDDGPLRLIFITCSVEAEFFEPVKKGMRDAAALMGVQAEFVGTEGLDLPAQVAMVRQAVKDGYDGIALNIVHTTEFDDVVRETIEQGVPVVAFNTDDQETPNARMSAVSQQLFAAGRSLAGRVLPEIPTGSHVLMTVHDAGISSLEARLAGEREVLRTKDVQWSTIVTSTDTETAVARIAKALREQPEIRVVLGTGQADTQAAGLAIERHFAGQGYWAAGFDLSPETLRLVKAGIIRCTIDQQPYVQGFYPVIQLCQYLRYGIRPADMDSGAAVIDASTVDRVIELSKLKYR
jgi:simple sugar transport system substrate-binding protein